MDITSLMADITTGSKTVKLLSVGSLESFERATINVKVTDVKDKTQVGGKSKQDFLVAGDSGIVRVIVWESHVNSMEKKTEVTGWKTSWYMNSRAQNT